MWQQKFRLLLIGMVIVGFGFGFALAIVEPPLAFELSVFVGLAVGGGLLGYLYRQKQKDVGAFDERAEQIELRANRASYSTLLIALGAVFTFDLFADITPYISVVLIGLLLGGIAVDELYIEWYRRKL